MIFVGENL